jgi:hypothetical protein
VIKKEASLQNHTSTMSEFVYSGIAQAAISEQIIFDMLWLLSLVFEMVINL